MVQETPKSLLMRNKRLADALGIRAALGAGAAIGGAKVMKQNEHISSTQVVSGGDCRVRTHYSTINACTKAAFAYLVRKLAIVNEIASKCAPP